MIKAVLTLDEMGRLISLSAKGHATIGKDGESLACAAFSVLLRTAFRCFEAKGLVDLAAADVPGELSWSLKRLGTADSEWTRGITDYLRTGIGDLAKEYPAEVSLVIDWEAVE